MPSAAPRHRIAFINTHPIQYFAPFYRYLNAHSDKVEAHAIYLSDMSLRGAHDVGFGQAVTWDVDLLSGTNAVFVKGAEHRKVEYGVTKMFAPDLWRILIRGGFDMVVVHGHRLASSWIAWAACRRLGIPFLNRGDTHLNLQASRLKTLARDLLMPIVFARYDGAFAIGSANRDYYRHMGMRDDQLFDLPFAVDNDRFIASSRLSAGERAAARAQLGLAPERCVILYAGKLQRFKRAQDLLEACGRAAAGGAPIALVIAGSGEMEAELKARAAHMPQLEVRFTGFVNQAELPRLMAACDIFCLPCENEAWGLAVNEAMCAGLAVIASTAIGCARDLVHEGETGALFEAGDIAGLTDAIARVLADWQGPRLMGANGRRLIDRFSYAAGVAGVERAVEVLGRNRR